MQFKKGFFCHLSQLQVLLPRDQFCNDKTNIWRIIGHAGVDGIEFRQKINSKENTVFAYYPIENLYTEKASSIIDLIRKWKTDELVL